jgi:outer membrane protein TolC
MSLRKILLLAGIALPVILLPCLPASAQRPDLPPEEVIIQALDNHPAVSAAQARVQSARAQEQMLRRGSHEFTLQGTVSRRSVDREGDYGEFDANITRPFRLPGKATMDRQAGALGVEVAHNMMEDVRHQTALTFSDLWHDWLTASALHRNDLLTAESLERSLRAVGRRAQLRDAAMLDVDQADSALAMAQAQAEVSRAQREEAQAKLAMIFPDVPLPQEAPDMADPVMPVEDVEGLRDHVIGRSHEIRAAEREAERLTVLARRARADRMPDPSLGVRLFSERGGMERGAGVVASIPLGGGNRKATSDHASAEAQAAQLDMARIRREVEAVAAADLSNVRARQAVWASMQRSAASAAAAATRTERGYTLGAIDLADSLLAQRQATEARRREIEARSDLLRAILKLRIDAHDIWTASEDHTD